jgi:hypothetical protein
LECDDLPLTDASYEMTNQAAIAIEGIGYYHLKLRRFNVDHPERMNSINIIFTELPLSIRALDLAVTIWNSFINFIVI